MQASWELAGVRVGSHAGAVEAAEAAAAAARTASWVESVQWPGDLAPWSTRCGRPDGYFFHDFGRMLPDAGRLLQPNQTNATADVSI